MSYFLKLVGERDNPLPEMWWEERPEIVAAIFFSRMPKRIQPRHNLIYYAVGGSKRCVAVAEVTGGATQYFPTPADWQPEKRKKFSWRMPVQLLSRCANNDEAPLLSDFYPHSITQGSFQSISDELGQALRDAIEKAGR